MKTFGKILKYTVIIIIVAINALLILRICSMKDPAAADALFPSDAMKTAYATSDALDIKTQERANGNITSDGRFASSGLRIIPQTGEIIITVRYNNSTLNDLAEEYELGETHRNDEYFEFSLLDSEGNRYYPDEMKSFKATVYNYRRLRFSGVKTDGMTEIVLCAYYKEDIDYSAEAFGTLFAYYSEWETEDYELTKSDIKALTKE